MLRLLKSCSSWGLGGYPPTEVIWAKPNNIGSPAKFGVAVPNAPVVKSNCTKSAATNPDWEIVRNPEVPGALKSGPSISAK